MYNQILFTNILRILAERGMSKTELSERAGVSNSFLSDLTNGKANPSLKTMEKIARALDTSLPLLLDCTDLDSESLEALAGGRVPSTLPPGYAWVSAVLPEYRAFLVRKWDQEARERIGLKK